MPHAKRSAVRSTAPSRAPTPASKALSVGYLMGRARASLLSALDVQLAPSGLSGIQFAVLKHLGEGSAHTAADLCRFMHYDTGAMTRILDRLEAKGLLRRERARRDRRQLLLRLAPAGRTQLPRLRAVAAHVLAGHLSGFSAAEIEALQTYLGRMIDNGLATRDNAPPVRVGRTGARA
jgi:DNA-binding MarR family transcriptional regulator